MVDSQRHRACVRVQSLGVPERNRGRSKSSETICAALQNRGSFQEIERAETGGKPRRTRGWQHMVGTAHIVADGLGRISAQKNGARIMDPFAESFGVRGHDFEVLRSKLVGERNAFLQIGDENNRAEVAPARRRNLSSCETSQLPLDRDLDGAGETRVIGDQD